MFMRSNCVSIPLPCPVLGKVVFVLPVSPSSILDFTCLLCTMNCRMKSVLSEEDEGSATGKSQDKREKEQLNGFHFPAVDPEQSLFASALTMVRYGISRKLLWVETFTNFAVLPPSTNFCAWELGGCVGSSPRNFLFAKCST